MQHKVYCVKGVTIIPLTETRAKAALSKMAASHSHLHLEEPTTAASFTDGVDSSLPPPEDSETTLSTSPRVKFAAEDQVKLMTPRVKDQFDLPHDVDDDSPPSPSSVVSTPSSEYSVNTGNIAKVLADKLSFWSRRSLRPADSGSSHAQARDVGQVDAIVENELDERELPLSLDHIIREGSQEPSEVLGEIISTAAPPPATIEEKHNELEDKIVRDCVREFTRGVMFFAYTFGM